MTRASVGCSGTFGPGPQPAGLEVFASGVAPLQRGVVGDAQAVGILHPRLARFQPCLDLRPGAVHQHQPDAEAVQQGDVVDQTGKGPARHSLAAEGDHKGATPVSMDIRR